MGPQTSIAGILDSTANATFALDFYASAALDRCSYAEGQTYLGFTAVNTDAAGKAIFIANLPVAVAPGYLITATATDPAGNTSAFSAPATVIGLSQTAALTLAQQPQDVAVAEGQTVAFSVKATATPAGVSWVFHQWRKNGLAIPGANAPSFITSENTLAGNGASYDCVLTIPGATVTSRAALLTVTNDVKPPALVSAEGNLTLTNITLIFSEPINFADASNPAHYLSSGGLTVSNATLLVDRRTVILTTSPQTPGSNYTVQVSGSGTVRPRATVWPQAPRRHSSVGWTKSLSDRSPVGRTWKVFTARWGTEWRTTPPPCNRR